VGETAPATPPAAAPTTVQPAPAGTADWWKKAPPAAGAISPEPAPILSLDDPGVLAPPVSPPSLVLEQPVGPPPALRLVMAGFAVLLVLVVAGVGLVLSLPSTPPEKQPIAAILPLPDTVLPVPQPDPLPPLPAVRPEPRPAPGVVEPEPIRVQPIPPLDNPALPVREPRPQPEPKVEPKADPQPAAEPAKLVIKRRKQLSETDLLRQIEKATEVALDRTSDRRDSLRMVLLTRQAAQQGKPFQAGPQEAAQRADLAGLPMRMGKTCELTAAAAEHLQGGSVTLRAHLFEAANVTATRRGLGSATGDTRPDPAILHGTLMKAGDVHNKWLKPEAIPALQQLLMAENESIRAVLVDQLARIPGARATVALAQRALFDLNADVREAALKALQQRPVGDYQDVLLAGFQYPWPEVANHAAEALVALQIKQAVPKLIRLLDMPDPSVPYEKPGRTGLFVKELVKINHLRNCLLCHAPALAESDKVRGFVPPTDRPLPAAFTREYYSPKQEGTFVRADITYLQQDFSVPLVVANHGHWPEVQRFDFMVRERPALVWDMPTPSPDRAPSEQHKAVFFVLRELTGQDPGPTAEDWKRLFLKRDPMTLLKEGLQNSNGIAVDAKGIVYVSDRGLGGILRFRSGASADTAHTLLAETVGCQGLGIDPLGRVVACQTERLRVIAIDPESKQLRVLTDGHDGKRFHGPVHLAMDRRGGVYFTDLPDPLVPRDHGSIYYRSPLGSLTRILKNLPHLPKGLGVSPDDKTLYVLWSESLEVTAYPLESAGAPGPGKVLCKLDFFKGDPVMGGRGMAVDGQGNLFLAHPARKAIQVVNAEGAHLGLVTLPDRPVDCAVGGEGGKTLFVVTPTAVHTMKLEAGLNGIASK